MRGTTLPWFGTEPSVHVCEEPLWSFGAEPTRRGEQERNAGCGREIVEIRAGAHPIRSGSPGGNGSAICASFVPELARAVETEHAFSSVCRFLAAEDGLRTRVIGGRL